MKIAFTGATGNVGTALVRVLTSADEHELIGLARRLPKDAGPVDPVRWVSVDLTRDACQADLRRAFHCVDAVVHLAWGFQPSHDPGYLAELGIGGTRRVLEAAVDEQVPHLVHVSSVGAYAPKRDDRPVDETWPIRGIPGSPYSRHKAAAEWLLDDHEARDDRAAPRITRMRPGIIGQRRAASALLRYGVPGLVPARALGWLPLLPLDRRLIIPMVHAEDVAQAIKQALARRAYGAFNLAAEPPITPRHIGAALRARPVHLPAWALRAAAHASWRARLQPVDPGWLDLAMSVPLLDTSRAREQLGWSPAHDAPSVLAEVVAGMTDAAAGPTPVLRPRTVLGQLRDRLQRGPISDRPDP